MQEGLFALLHADGVHDRLAADAFQARLDHFPFGGVDHHRNPADVRFRRHELEEGRHRLDRSEEHTSELQSLMRISYAVFCLKKTIQRQTQSSTSNTNTMTTT